MIKDGFYKLIMWYICGDDNTHLILYHKFFAKQSFDKKIDR